MLYRYKVKSEQFILMIPPCKAWQILVDSELNLKRGDYIEVIEVDSQYDETGNRLIGVVRWIGSGDMVVNNNSSTFAYTIQIKILPQMRTIIFTFNQDADGSLNNKQQRYNTTGTEWSLVSDGNGTITLTPTNDFDFMFKTVEVGLPNDAGCSIIYPDTSSSTTTVFQTVDSSNVVSGVNQYGSYIKIDFYV